MVFWLARQICSNGSSGAYCGGLVPAIYQCGTPSMSRTSGQEPLTVGSLFGMRFLTQQPANISFERRMFRPRIHAGADAGREQVVGDPGPARLGHVLRSWVLCAPECDELGRYDVS